MILYDFERSGNCYKIRLFLSILGIPYERRTVDLQAGAQRQAEFLALNPRGQIPVLEDQGLVLCESAAILAYLARTYAPSWLPEAPVPLARILQWLILEQNEGRYGLARARAIALKAPSALARTGTLEESVALASKALSVLDQQLQQSPWLVAEHPEPTIADIACYPYVALAPEGGLSLTPFAAIGAWIRRLSALPGHLEPPRARPA
ncbi:MAG TPA: glutathione S-transferase family protein [Acidiferrobacteraceae bacterium]|nr:glutathione S-transferase family protein [Acidiferrobacteraceae bacterium]